MKINVGKASALYSGIEIHGYESIKSTYLICDKLKLVHKSPPEPIERLIKSTEKIEMIYLQHICQKSKFRDGPKPRKTQFDIGFPSAGLASNKVQA